MVFGLFLGKDLQELSKRTSPEGANRMGRSVVLHEILEEVVLRIVDEPDHLVLHYCQSEERTVADVSV